MNTLAALNVISSQDWPAHSQLSPDFQRRNDKLQRMLEHQSEGNAATQLEEPRNDTSQAARIVATGLELLY